MPNILFIGTILFLLLQVWKGWAKGVVRQGLNLCALLCAITIGWWVYTHFENLVGALFRGSQTFIGGILAFSFGLFVYLCIGILTAILFKKTSQQNSSIVRLFYGLGGAICGVASGLVIIAGLLSLTQHVGGNKDQLLYSGSPFSFESLLRSTTGLSETKKPWAAFRASAGSIYETLQKISRVTSNPIAVHQFLQYPTIRKIEETRAVRELLANPQFAEAVSHRNIVSFLLNSKFYRTLQDPEVGKALRNTDLNKALDYALERRVDGP